MKPLTDFVLDFILNSLWQPVLPAAIAAFCLRLPLRGSSAQHHYVVWVAALILSVLLPFWSALLERNDQETGALTGRDRPIGSWAVACRSVPSSG